MKPITAVLLGAALLALFPATPGLAQVQEAPPAFVDYQGLLFDSNGIPLAPDVSGNPAPINYEVVFRVWDASSGGNLVWAEKQNVTVSAGRFSVQLGRGTTVAGATPQFPPAEINRAFAGAQRFLGVAVTIPPATSGTEIVPRLQFLTTPFAFAAEKAVNAQSLTQTTGTASITTASITNATIANATITTGVTGNGSGLTALNATNVTTGTVADARLTANVALLNRTQVFTGSNNFDMLNLTEGRDLSVYGASRPHAGRNFHGMGYYGPANSRPFSGINIDGPVLYGWNGGALASTSNSTERICFRWTNAGILGVPGTDAIEFNTFGAKNTFDCRIGFGIAGADAFELVGGGSGSQTGGLNRRFNFHAQGGSNFFGGLTVNGTSTVNGSAVINGSAIAGGRITSVLADQNGQFRGIFSGSLAYTFGPNFAGDFVFVPDAGTFSFIKRNDGNYFSGSDVRLKKDIVTIDNALERTLKLRPVSYRFKVNSDDSLKALGFVAQEVEPLFPEAVAEHNGMKSLAYSELIPVAIAAIQEQHARMESVVREKDEQIKQLEEKNAEMERRLKAIEAKLNF